MYKRVFFVHLSKDRRLRGVRSLGRAEIIPSEPAADNADEGKFKDLDQVICSGFIYSTTLPFPDID